jgi:hypothetical protein
MSLSRRWDLDRSRLESPVALVASETRRAAMAFEQAFACRCFFAAGGDDTAHALRVPRKRHPAVLFGGALLASGDGARLENRERAKLLSAGVEPSPQTGARRRIGARDRQRKALRNRRCVGRSAGRSRRGHAAVLVRRAMARLRKLEGPKGWAAARDEEGDPHREGHGHERSSEKHGALTRADHEAWIPGVVFPLEFLATTVIVACP